MTCADDRGKVRRLRNRLIMRGDAVKQTRKSAHRDGFLEGLEYAVVAIDREFGDVF
jgi:hypothetical protein